MAVSCGYSSLLLEFTGGYMSLQASGLSSSLMADAYKAHDGTASSRRSHVHEPAPSRRTGPQGQGLEREEDVSHGSFSFLVLCGLGRALFLLFVFMTQPEHTGLEEKRAEPVHESLTNERS